METTKKPNVFQRIFAIRGMGQVITVTGGLIILCVIFGRMNSNFFSERNVPNLLRQIAPFLLVGIGQSYVLITGNIDLSIGSVLGMSCMMSATLMTMGVDPALACLVTIICCLAVGILNGVLVSMCKIPPFIATLGTMTICRGIAQLVNNNQNTDSIGPGAQVFRDMFYYSKNLNFGGKFLGIFQTEALIKIPQESFWSFLNYFNMFNTVLIVLVLWIVFNYLLSKTRTGRYIYAVGSNIEAAKLSGVNVPMTVIKAYTVSAFCACITGLIQCAQGGLGTMDAGLSYELYAVAASVIGGVSTLGGQGILLGTIVGACVWGVMQNGLSIAGAPLAFRNIIIGIIVVLAVLADILVRNGRRSIRGLLNKFWVTIIGAISIIIFVLNDWGRLITTTTALGESASMGFGLLKFGTWNVNEISALLGLDFSTIIMVINIFVVLVIFLQISLALLIISWLKHQSKVRATLVYWGFGLTAFVSLLFICGIMFINSRISGLTAGLYSIAPTVYPFSTLIVAGIMIFFVAYTERSLKRVNAPQAY